MKEVIDTIEQSLGEKKQTIRRLVDEQDKLLYALNENFAHRKSLENSVCRLECELKQLYEQQYQRKGAVDCCTADKVSCESSVKVNSIEHGFRPSY